MFFLRQMFPLHLLAAPAVAPLFLRGLVLFGLMVGQANADVRVKALMGADYLSAREALVESVEAEGLVVGAVLPFAGMLSRTGGEEASPYTQAEIVQFCSSVLARQMVREAPQQLALCPLSIAVYATKAEPGKVFYAWRTTGGTTPAKAAADALLKKLVERATGLARIR
jgi:uncharacterized protein (DUF302 family)